MATFTDPASELALIADLLAQGGGEAGDKFLANAFEVEPWSTEFVKILACIHERCDLVERIVARSSLDAAVIDRCREDLMTFRSAFSGRALHESWHNAPGGGLSKVTAGSRLAYLQSTVRAEVAYPRLSEEDVTELLGLIDTYLTTLADNPDELPVIRQAIVDGLEAFRFQLRWLRWMGAAYALSTFRALVWTYEQAHRQFPEDAQPEAAEILDGLLGVITSFAEKAKAAAGYADAAQWMWKAYSVASPFVVPLLAAGNLPRLTG